MIVNFLRAVYHDPHTVAHYANWYITELDLTARHTWLVKQKPSLVQQLATDPEYHDARIAGWWVWGINNWIGSGWCGKNVSRNLPKIPHVSGYLSVDTDLAAYFEKLSQRLRGNICKIVCGDWKRCLTPSCTIHSGIPVGVFLDPPYAGDRSVVYASDDTNVCFEVLNWCKEKGQDVHFRIALCGYTGYYDELESMGWTPYYWSSNGGYGNQGQGKGRVNRHREVVWFSPHCQKPVSDQQLEFLFSY